MNRTIERRLVWPALLALGAVCGILALTAGAPVVPFGICGYMMLALVPGGAFYVLVSRKPTLLGLIVSATALSPVLVATLAAGAMLAGIPARATAGVLIVLAGSAALRAWRRQKPLLREPALGRGQAAALLILIVAVVAAISYLPFTRDWWRMRADAWFHAAVVAQIADYGVPPEDPYAAGLPLQYMWFFHVFVLVLSEASGIGRFMIMALANVHALIAFGLVAFLFSAGFKKSFPHNYAATLTAIFGMNAGFWALIPFKLIRTFTGEVRGMEDLGRLLALRPFDVFRVRRFVQVAHNQEFLLDKFMVATAFSLGLCLMALLWYAATKYLSEGKREDLTLAFVSAFGVMVMHTALGSVVFGGVIGGAFLLIVFGRLRGGAPIRPPINLVVALLACGVLLLPYLHSVSRAKGDGPAIPIGLSGPKMIGIVSSCALVIFLAGFQLKRVLRSTDIATRFLLCSTAAVLGICTLINLPAANSYDKLPFLVFFPLAIVGAWTIADFAQRARTPARRRLRFVLAGFLAFAPLNLLMFAGYYVSPAIYRLNAAEKDVAAWVRSNTPRDAVIFDTNQRGFLLVAGPRRYFLGSEDYAEIWGYDKEEIARRKRIIRDLYSPDGLETPTLEDLGNMTSPLFVVVRRDDPTVDTHKFVIPSALFAHVFSSGPISVFEIQRDACLSLLGRNPESK